MDGPIQQLIEKARDVGNSLPLAPGCVTSGALARRVATGHHTVITDGWSVTLCMHRHGAVEHWHFSACLSPPGRGSTVKDWRKLGEIAALAGCPPEPVTDLETTHPNAVFHWVWHSDGSPVVWKGVQAMPRLTLKKRRKPLTIRELVQLFDSEGFTVQIEVRPRQPGATDWRFLATPKRPREKP